MPNFVWVPVGGDESIDLWAGQLTAIISPYKAWMLPAATGKTPHSNRPGAWANLQAGDQLSICGHGDADSTKQVGWATDTGVVIWQYSDLANAIAGNLSDPQKAQAIQFELLICWSADNKAWKDPFAYRVAAELGRLSVHGTVIGYKGAMVMRGDGKSMMVHGSGRFTSRFGSGLRAREFTKAFHATPEDSLHIDKFNHYDFSKQRKTFNIP